MKIGKMSRLITVGNPCFLQIPPKPLDSRKSLENQVLRLTISLNFTQCANQFRMQTQRRWLTVFGSGGPDLYERCNSFQIHITPLERRQFRPVQARMHG